MAPVYMRSKTYTFVRPARVSFFYLFVVFTTFLRNMLTTSICCFRVDCLQFYSCGALDKKQGCLAGAFCSCSLWAVSLLLTARNFFAKSLSCSIKPPSFGLEPPNRKFGGHHWLEPLLWSSLNFFPAMILCLNAPVTSYPHFYV